MESFEKNLKKVCPGIFELHNPDLFADKKELKVISDEEETPPVIKEWQTLRGKRAINEEFINNMKAGY